MRFYVIKPEGGLFHPKWAYATPVEPSYSDDCERCPVCGGPVAMLRWLPPHRIVLSSAKPEKWGDFVWGAGFGLLVSSRFEQVYHQEGLTGIETLYPPAQVVRMGRGKTGAHDQAPVYHPIHVPWGGASQDDVASGVAYELPEKVTCSYCRVGVAWRKQPRVVIEEASWNGADIFVARGTPALFVVSERFKRAVEDHGLTNVMLIPAEKYGYDERRRGLWYVNE